MMPREADFSAKQESSNTDKAASSSSTTASWSRFKDPRIVRVSKAFGGKDRHSKVCTVRGLRDRRVRLSVPTAIQLYDLQERLGLNQPSKVVDWLLDVAKHEIDELPPLQIPQGTFSQALNPSQSDKQGLQISGETSDRNDASWTTSSHEEEGQLSHFLSRQNPSSFTSLLSSTTAPYNSFVRWDPSNLSLSHPPISLGLTDQNEDLHNFNLVQLPPAVSVHPGSHQVLVYQPGINTTPPYFPSQSSPKQPNFHCSDLSSSSTHQPVRPFHFTMTADLLPSQDNAADERNKRDGLHSS